MKPLYIVNPRSGGGRTGQVFEGMRRTIERIAGPFEVAFTERPRHAVDLARDAAADGRDTVIAVGGDGSIHEVTCGLMAAREANGGELPTKLGILGQGTGGDFRRTLGIDHRLDRYLQVIAAGKTREVDVGRFTYQAHDGTDKSAYFINILSVGMGGLVDQYVADIGRTVGGTAAYLVASLRGIAGSVEGHLKVTARHAGKETVEHFSARILGVCNGRFFGSGMEVAPMADPSDGQFEVITMGGAKLSFILTLPRVYSGKHLTNPDVRHFPCDRITVELENESVADRFLLDVDGEPLGRLPLTIELVPRALRVLAP
ncbi:MAG: diacylglycerol kinase family lipid kinase [Polyangiaceae bacterium]